MTAAAAALGKVNPLQWVGNNHLVVEASDECPISTPVTFNIGTVSDTIEFCKTKIGNLNYRAEVVFKGMGDIIFLNKNRATNNYTVYINSQLVKRYNDITSITINALCPEDQKDALGFRVSVEHMNHTRTSNYLRLDENGNLLHIRETQNEEIRCLYGP